MGPPAIRKTKHPHKTRERRKEAIPLNISMELNRGKQNGKKGLTVIRSQGRKSLWGGGE